MVIHKRAVLWWRLGITFLAALVIGAGAVAVAQSPSNDVADLLPHAIALWQAGTIEPSGDGTFDLLGIADLNGDGFPDLVCSFDRRVMVMFGNGNGSFSPGPWVYYETVEYKEGMKVPGRFLPEDGQQHWTPYELQEEDGKRCIPTEASLSEAHGVLADFDGDGRKDLAVAVAVFEEDRETWKLYFFQGEGGGVFSERYSTGIPFPMTFGDMLAADLDGDGKKELIMAHGAMRVSTREERERHLPAAVYRLDWEPSGEFGSPIPLYTEEGVNLELADLNGDGFPDLVLYTGKTAKVLFWKDGGFGKPVVIVPGKEEVEGVALGDLNGDGKLDLAVLTARGIVTELQGEGGFVESSHFDLGTRPWQAILADFDGDGNEDALVQITTGHWDFVFLPGDGKGGFLGEAGRFVVPDNVGLVPRVSDLNNDGRPDILFWAVANRAYVYLNGGEAHGVSLHPLPGRPLAVTDLDGNGRDDIVVGTSNGIGVFWNSGHGFVYSTLASDLPTPLAGAKVNGKLYVLSTIEGIGTGIQAFTPAGEFVKSWRVAEEEAIPTLAVGDFDGDGVKDIAFPTKKELFVLWAGKELRGYPWLDGDLSLITTWDHDGDGIDELVCISTSEYADLVRVSLVGRKLAVSEPLLQLEALPLALATGDIDGDGATDVAVIATTFKVEGEGDEAEIVTDLPVLGMVLSSGGGKMVTLPGFPSGDAPTPFQGLVAGDFTGDGRADLAYTTSQGAGLYILPGKGDGTFAKAVRKDVPAGPVLAGDLDGNGEDELITATWGIAPLLVILWNGGER